ncbi:transposase [Bartonella quintana]|uniref:transposase n=1 Tax=Bartonella quintana TaxID=803 RepID=UPI003312F863
MYCSISVISKKIAITPKKEKCRYAKLHKQINNIKEDFLHKLTTQLVQRSKPVYLENLHRKGMLKNRHLSRVFKNQSFLNFNGNENITLHSMVGSLLFLIIICQQ